jgi:farnesol dehydrogenase
MNRVLVTGATGFLGRSLVNRLAGNGNIVHALYRSEEKIRGWDNENIHFFNGTLDNRESLDRAMEGCREVYHLASFVGTWARDSTRIYEQNVGGTVNVLEAAGRAAADKIVLTSTAGVLGPSKGKPVTEDAPLSSNHFTHYDRSKAMAEEKTLEYASRGLPVIIVNPTRVYGPGNLSKSNALTDLVSRYVLGNWRLRPGSGSSIGNYVFIDDAVNCHLLAMEKGRPGQRYIAGGDNLSFDELFEILARVSGIERKLFTIPYGLMLAAAVTFQGAAWLTGWDPPIIPAFIRRYTRDWEFSSEKAKRELGYRPRSFEEGLRETIEWIRG